VGEDRFAGSAAHALNSRLSLGARVQYTRLPAFSAVRGVIALGIGVRHQPVAGLPMTIAAMAATEGQEAYWLAGVDYSSAERWSDLVMRAEYGASGGQLASGITHRAAVIGQWRNLAEGTLGLAVEPDGEGRAIQPVLGAAIRYHRYRLGVVREQLPNDFGGAYSFRFGVSF